MKKSLFAIAATMLAAQMAHADVTLYGNLDTSIRYTNNTDTSTSGKTAMTQGAAYPNYWGLRGKEGLGGGLKAIFQFEQSFNLYDGTQGDSNRLSGRAAFAGLEGRWGSVTLGRQDSVMNDFMGIADIYGVANYPEDAFFGNHYAGRFDNMVRYELSQGGLNVVLGYALSSKLDAQKRGETAPNTSDKNDNYGASLSYTANGFMIGGAYQNEKSYNNLNNAKWSSAVGYTADRFALRAFYLNTQDHLSATSLRKDSTVGIGGSMQFTPSWALSGSVYHDKIDIDGQSGKHWTVMGILDYALSKRTVAYVTADYTKASGSGLVDLNQNVALTDNKSRVGLGVGLRLKF